MRASAIMDTSTQQNAAIRKTEAVSTRKTGLVPLMMVVLWMMTMLWVGCQNQAPSPADSEAAINTPFSVDELAGQMVAARDQVEATAVLSGYPDMDRETAYQIQLGSLHADTGGDDALLIGWKMGGTRVVDASVPPDPSFAYSLTSDSLASGSVVQASSYIDGDLLVEAEIAFVMNQDMPDGGYTKQEVADAVREVAGAIELIDVRILPGDDGDAPTMNHNIAANLAHAGLILTETRRALNEVDIVAESATVFVDGEEKATGAGGQIMNTTPLDALHWIVNELPKHGRFLRAGDVVITGGLYDNPTLTAGSTAEVRFDSFGEISVSMIE